MKMNKFALATLAALAMGITGASAQTSDLILSFDDLSGNNTNNAVSGTDLEFDLGSYTNYTTTTATETVLNVNSLLTGLYTGGHVYSTSTGIKWDVAGADATGATDLIDITTTLPNQANPGSTSQENGNISNVIDAVEGAGISEGTQETPTSLGNVLEDPKSNLNSFNSQGGETGFGGIQGDVTTGAGSMTLVEYNDSATPKIEGTFTLSSNGNLTFVGASEAAVPEPSTYALFISGALLLFVALRRRKTVV